MKKAALCLIAAGLAAAAAPYALAKEAKPAPAAAATSDDIGLGRSNQPLDVTADQGIEFSKDAKEIIARVNAKAVRGNTTVTGDTLTAYYRDKKPADASAPPPKAKNDDKPKDDSSTGGSEVWRVVADGNVEIYTPTQHAYGDHADYNVDDAVVVMTGDHLKMTTPQDIVTARDTLEYWENKHQAVARGDAVAIQGEKRIQADMLVADFAENKQKQMVIQVAHGYDHVILTTPTDVVTGDRADYVVETGIVTITGSVKMNHNGNQGDGAFAVINLNTGISKLFSSLPGSKAADRQVKALLVPAPKKAPAPAPQTAPKVP